MDDKDRALLAALRRDARRSAVALAREVELSRSTVQERIERLRATGAIKGFTIVEGERAFRQSAHFLVKLAPGRSCSQLAPRLRKLAGIVAAHSLAGEFDMLVRVDVESVQSVEAIRGVLTNMPSVAGVTTLISLERHID